MIRRIYILLVLACITQQAVSQHHKTYQLQKAIERVLSGRKVTVGLSLKNLEENDTLSINGEKMMPMMSVFKFHIALAILHQVDIGKLALQQRFLIKRDSLHANTWSPMRDEYPEGDVYFTLDQLLKYTVCHSDNNGCDILIDIAGGTAVIENFIRKHGVKDCVIRLNEHQMCTWDNLYVNTTTPLASTALLERFLKGKILKKGTTKYLYQSMVATSRGLTWMKAGLPAGTEFAHRTGISGTNEQNMRAAMNDVGIITLPDGKHVILSLFLMNISEQREIAEKIFSDIASTVWHHYTCE